MLKHKNICATIKIFMLTSDFENGIMACMMRINKVVPCR